MAAAMALTSSLHDNITGNSGMDVISAMNESYNTSLVPMVIKGPPWGPLEKVFFGIWLSISMLCATIGNLMVIVVVARHRGMQTRTNMFLVNLAIADFLVGLLLAPFALTTLIKERWIFGEVLCNINGFLNAVCFVTSIHTLMHISLHKYVSIIRPFSRILNRCKILLMIGCAWCWAIICGVLTMFILSHVVYKEKTMQCGPEYPTSAEKYLHHVIIQTTNIILPLAIMIFAYSRMYCEFRQHALRLQKNTTLQSDQIIGQQIQVTKTLFIVLACFMLCWLPYLAYSTYVTMVPDKSSIPGWANAAAYCFMYMNSGCNPIIYAWRSPSFREGYKEILCQRPSYIVSDDTIRDSDSPSIIRRLSTMLHSSFRATRFGSRRNSEDATSVNSSHMLRPVSPGHRAPLTQLRRATSKTAKGSSIIRKDGTVILTKNGKIISVRQKEVKRDNTFSGFSDIEHRRKNGVSRSLSDMHSVQKDTLELTPLLHSALTSSCASSAENSMLSSAEDFHMLKPGPASAGLQSVTSNRQSHSAGNLDTAGNFIRFSSGSEKLESGVAESASATEPGNTFKEIPPHERQISDDVFEMVSPVVITFNSEEAALNTAHRAPSFKIKVTKSDLALNRELSKGRKGNTKRKPTNLSKSSDVVFRVPLQKCPSLERLDGPEAIPRCASDVTSMQKARVQSPLYKQRPDRTED